MKKHSVSCLYEYSLARLGLTDTPEMRVLFWDAHDSLEWCKEKDWYKTPEGESQCAACDDGKGVVQ